MSDSLLAKKTTFGKILLRVFIILFSIILIGEVINLAAYPGKNNYFLPAKNKIKFNYSLLEDSYKTISKTPYNYCQDFNLHKKPGSYRIFLIGEVPLSGWPYSKQQSIGKKIEDNLKIYAPGKEFEIITISFAGFNSFHAVEIIPQLLKNYKPDQIILYAGHNEFYGYKGNISQFDLSKLFVVNIIEQLFNSIGTVGIGNYNSEADDLELLMPLNAVNKFIYKEKSEYTNTVYSFNKNINYIAGICSESKTKLILTELADNNLLPPIGIVNVSNQLSADLIFNNARMALLRDGNESIAERLFNESIEQDAFRLRIPPDFNIALRRIAGETGVELLSLKEPFNFFSQNHIPGSDLYVDYIHPNLAGINIIAAEFTRNILEKIQNSQVPPIEEILKSQSNISISSMQMELSLEKRRMDKSSEYLRNADLLQTIAPASTITN